MPTRTNQRKELADTDGDGILELLQANGIEIPSNLTVDGNTVWHGGNDGPGSGLNADQVDDTEASSLGGAVVEKDYTTDYSEDPTHFTFEDIKTRGGSAALTDGVVADFEDGTLQSTDRTWGSFSGDSLSAQQGVVISDSWSMESDSDNQYLQHGIERSTGYSPTRFEFKVQISNQTNTDDDVEVWIGGGGGTMFFFRFYDNDGSIYLNGFGTNLQSWSAGTTYHVVLDNIDYANNNADIIINGTNHGNFGFSISTGNINSFSIDHATDQSGTRRQLYVDDIQTSYTSTSGTITFEPPIPEDVFDWASALFTRTLDSETVDVYIDEYDGSWTEIQGPISRGDKITASPSNNVRLRAEISRADTSNSPSLDSIARTWEI
jgi:hypothetical protein